MKICSACDHRLDRDLWRCPACGHEVAVESGFRLFAPETARDATGFNPTYYAELSTLEARNFWFRARNDLVTAMLRKYFGDAGRFLEIGCGTGYVLAGIARALPGFKLSGSELFAQGLPFAAARAPGAELFQMDARAIPYENEFNVIGAFDVLEHIDEDELVLAQMHRAVADGGGIMLTVPQHRFLWSRHDEYACHVRRYEAAELRAKVERAGFTVMRATSFVTLLLPLMALARWIKRKPAAEFDPMAELRLGSVLNGALKAVLDVEVALVRAGANLPVGGSLMMIARKS